MESLLRSIAIYGDIFGNGKQHQVLIAKVMLGDIVGRGACWVRHRFGAPETSNSGPLASAKTSGVTGDALPRPGVGPRLFRQTQNLLANDSALHLTRTGVDGSGTSIHEHIHPTGTRVG